VPTKVEIEAAAEMLYQIEWSDTRVAPINRESTKAALRAKARVVLEAAERVREANCTIITFSDAAP
jgi:hypothetical protein